MVKRPASPLSPSPQAAKGSSCEDTTPAGPLPTDPSASPDQPEVPEAASRPPPGAAAAAGGGSELQQAQVQVPTVALFTDAFHLCMQTMAQLPFGVMGGVVNKRASHVLRVAHLPPGAELAHRWALRLSEPLSI